MTKKAPKRQPTNEVLRNTRVKAKHKAIKTMAEKGAYSKEAEREKVLHHNADRAVKRQAAQKKKTAAKKRKK